MSITPEQAAALRKPFPRESIGILPKPYKADSLKGQCSVCNGYHGLPAVHLDYVGHAAVTDRLLTVEKRCLQLGAKPYDGPPRPDLGF